MSHFCTPIPVDVDRIKKLLPPGTTFDRVEWNKEKSCVDVFWHNGQLQTRYSWAFPFTIAQLEAKEIPDGVTTPGQREDMRINLETAKHAEEIKAKEEAEAKAKAEKEEAIKRAKELGLIGATPTLQAIADGINRMSDVATRAALKVGLKHDKQNVLTATNVSATSQRGDKAPEIVAGLPVRQTPRDRTRGRTGANRPRPGVAGLSSGHSTASKTAVERTGPGPTGQLPTGQHGPKTPDHA